MVIWGRSPNSADYVTLFFELNSPQLQTVLPAQQQQTFQFLNGEIGTFAVQEIVSNEVGSLALLIIAYRELLHARNSEALRILTRVTELKPDQSFPYYLIGETLRALKRFDEAETNYTKSILLDPKNPHAFLGRGLSHFNRSHLAEAVRDCSSAIQLQPQLPDPYTIRGDSYFQLGDITNGISDHNKYLSIRTNDWSALVRRAMGYAKLNDFSSAISDLKEAARFSDDVHLLKAIEQGLDIIEKILIRKDSLNRIVIGFEWLATDSNNQIRTNYASGILLQGTKAVYAVTSANVARQINTNGVALLCSASNRISKISLAELGERHGTIAQIPLWFYEPSGGDCAALPFFWGHTTGLPPEKLKLLKYIVPIPLPLSIDDTNAPAAGDEVTLFGINPTFATAEDSNTMELHSTVKSGLSIDNRGNRYFLVNGALSANYDGGPVFQSMTINTDMRMNRITVHATLKEATSWGIVAEPEIPLTPRNQTRVIHRSQIVELLRGLENTINILWGTNNAHKKSI